MKDRGLYYKALYVEPELYFDAPTVLEEEFFDALTVQDDVFFDALTVPLEDESPDEDIFYNSLPCINVYHNG